MQKISLVEIRIRFVGILTLTIVLMGLVGGGEVEERTFRYNASQFKTLRDLIVCVCECVYMHNIVWVGWCLFAKVFFIIASM